MMFLRATLLCSLLGNSMVAGFAPLTRGTGSHFHVLSSSTGVSEVLTTKSEMMEVPLTVDEMVKQISVTMLEAKEVSGIDKQIVRMLLPRDVNSANLGTMYEKDNSNANNDDDIGEETEFILVPPDESWQGGIMQLYRAAVPTGQEIVKGLCNTFAVTGIPPKLIEDRSVDESGVDGVGLLTASLQPKQQSNSGNDNSNEESSPLEISAYVQPLQETIPTVFKNMKQNDSVDELTVLINPQWRIVDDVLDTASKMDGFFGSFANFLGGKGGVLKQLDDANFQSIYILEGYVCRNRNVRLFKRFNTDWTVWAETDASTPTSPIYLPIGETFPNRPTYQEIEKLLDDAALPLQ